MQWWRNLSRRRRASLLRGLLYVAFGAVLLAFVLAVDWARTQDALFKWDLITEQFPEILTRAAWHTLIFTFFGYTGGLVIGLVLALMRLSPIKPFRWSAAIYIEVVRGIPLLVWILLIGLALPLALGIRFSGTYTKGSLALAIVAGAYMAETIRAGIEAVPRGQMEAARSLGMSYGQAMQSIVLPQAFRIIIPPLTNELVLLLKDTSLISAVGVTAADIELARWGRNGVNTNANATPLIVAGLVYLVLTIPLTRLAAVLEKRGGRGR
jgi:polar amino acid transport system permease protein